MDEENLFYKAIAVSRDGVLIAKAVKGSQDYPIIFANKAFELLTGYTQSEILGKDFRFLQGEDTHQPQILQIREALDVGKPLIVTLRNYRKDGSLFWNELTLSPIFDLYGRTTHYIGVQKDVSERIQLIEKNTRLEKATKTDVLTGLYNRNVISNEGALLWESAKRFGGSIGVLFIDIDHFKAINDTFGHDVGDACLHVVSSVLVDCCERKTDLSVRYGGEEFLVLSPGKKKQMIKLADSILKAVRDEVIELDEGGETIKLTVSTGLSVAKPAQYTSLWQLIQAADQAMYRAKRLGRDRVVVAVT